MSFHVSEDLNYILSNQNFTQNFQLKHQLCRRIPSNLQARVDTEIEKLLEEGHIVKLKNCSE